MEVDSLPSQRSDTFITSTIIDFQLQIPWRMVERRVACDVRCVACGVWCEVCGVRCVKCGVWRAAVDNMRWRPVSQVFLRLFH